MPIRGEHVGVATAMTRRNAILRLVLGVLPEAPLFGLCLPCIVSPRGGLLVRCPQGESTLEKNDSVHTSSVVKL